MHIILKTVQLTGSPRVLSLKIIGEAVEGNTMIADKKYWGGAEGDSVFRWFLVSRVHQLHLFLLYLFRKLITNSDFWLSS